MLRKQHLKSTETGFTLIELLTVIIIIGVLAAIAIPVFSAQRSRTQDSQTVSDVRNIVTAAETYLSDKNNSVTGLSQTSLEYASSKNVLWDVKGNVTTGGYCIAAFNASGKEYNTDQKLLTYDSTAGGLKKSGGSCAGTNGGGNTPTPTNSTAVGSSTATPTLPAGATAMAVGEKKDYAATSTGNTGSLQNFIVPTTGTYKIEAYGARGGNGSNELGANGAYATGTVTLTIGQRITILVGQSGTSATPGGGGGGGSFVTTADTNSGTALVVAGGGGGGAVSDGAPGLALPGNTASGGTASSAYLSVSSNGAGGYSAADGGGGGGYLGDGQDGSAARDGRGGKAFPGLGANPGTSSGCGVAGIGGYGGGGSGGCYDGGGGGGYSGGSAGGGGFNAYDGNNDNIGGGGGGSYIVSSYNGQAVTNPETNNTTKSNNGQGKVTITRIS